MVVNFWGPGAYDLISNHENDTLTTDSSSFSPLSQTVTAPSNAKYARMEMRLYGAGTAWFDDISFNTGTTSNTCIGDFNSDNQVNLSDYFILTQNFLKNPLPNSQTDLTGDGAVNLSDYFIFVGRFLKGC